MWYLLLAIVVCITSIILAALLKGQVIHNLELSCKNIKFHVKFGKEKVDNARNITDLEKK